MTRTPSNELLVGLVRELLKLPQETEWVEFKQNNDNPQEIGEYISALANSAALEEKAFAYMVWGIDDATHAVVGTKANPKQKKVGNEELENWLLRLLSPKIDFQFFEVTCDEGRIVLLEIHRAFPHPVKFSGEEFIRVGSYKKKLKDFPEKERALWRVLDKTPFEKGIAAEAVEDTEVLRLLDAPAYFQLLEIPQPDGRAATLRALAADALVQGRPDGKWNITNLGAILFATKLSEFRGLKRKAMRVVVYKGQPRARRARAGRREGLRDRLRGTDGVHRCARAAQRGHRAGVAPKRADVPGSRHSGAGRQCSDSPGLLRAWHGTDGGDLRGPPGDHEPWCATGAHGPVRRLPTEVSQ